LPARTRPPSWPPTARPSTTARPSRRSRRPRPWRRPQPTRSRRAEVRDPTRAACQRT